MNVGEPTSARSIPSPEAIPRANTVFPEPRSPCSRIVSPPLSVRPSASPSLSVSASERLYMSSPTRSDGEGFLPPAFGPGRERADSVPERCRSAGDRRPSVLERFIACHSRFRLLACQLLQREGQMIEDVSGHEPFLSEDLGGEVSRASVDVYAEENRTERIEASGEEPRQDAREDIAGPSRRHARVSGAVHVDPP